MRICIDLLEKCGVCGDALTWTNGLASRLNKETLTHAQGREELLPYIQTLDTSSSEAWLQWYDALPSNPIAVKYYNDWTYTGKYAFFNKKTNKRSAEYSSEADMQNALAEEKTILIDDYLDNISVNLHVSNDDNTVTWVPVDVRNLTQEAEYQVFNPLRGTHRYCATLELARERIASIQNSYANIMLIQERQITNPDGDLAWDI